MNDEGRALATETRHQSESRVTLHLATTVEANEFLADDPLALVIGMLLDQQILMEKAFTSPQVLATRMGLTRLDAREIAAYDPDAFELLFREVPALHRFPAAMAKRTQALCDGLVADVIDPGSLQKVRAFKKEQKAAARAV